eukprot:655551-Lingulodinium_polyedra.AAC.1
MSPTGDELAEEPDVVMGVAEPLPAASATADEPAPPVPMEEEAPEWPTAEGGEEAFARMQHVASEAHAEGVDFTLPP